MLRGPAGQAPEKLRFATVERGNVMAKNDFKVMDWDMHVIEPKDLWQTYIDPDFKNQAPRGVDRFHGDMQLDFNGHLTPDEPVD